jgi:hypothetical protein
MKPLEDPDRIRELVTEYFVFARRLASPSRSERLVAQTGNPLDDLLTRRTPSGATSQPLGVIPGHVVDQDRHRGLPAK